MVIVSVIAILEDEKGRTIGARLRNSQGDIWNYTTKELCCNKCELVCVNATIDKNGFVRGKNCSLERMYLRTTFRGREVRDTKEASRLIEQGIISVYHGNKSKLMTPKYGGGDADSDYGNGFYLTPDIELAKEWSQSNYSVGTGYLHSYTLDLRDLKVLDLTKESVRYGIAELMYNRYVEPELLEGEEFRDTYINVYRYPNIKQFDVIIGYRADDSFFRYIKDFISEIITEDELRDVMQFGGLGLQVCLKSRKSFDKLVKVDKVRKVDEKYIKKSLARDSKAKNDYSKCRREVRSKQKNTRGLFISQILEVKMNEL